MIEIILVIAMSIIWFSSGVAYQKHKELKKKETETYKLRSKSLMFKIRGEWYHIIVNSDFTVMLDGKECEAVANIMCFDKLLTNREKFEIYNACKGFDDLDDNLKDSISFAFPRIFEI